jgi:predicted CopG family antitoxin
MNGMRARHTITINHQTYEKLKSKGTFGESYSELISRLADLAEYHILKQELRNE